VPISVLLITLFLNRLIANREKSTRLEKLNMVISSFFSEVGTPLLKRLLDFHPEHNKLRQELILTSEWTNGDFSKAHTYVQHQDYSIRIQKNKLKELREFLVQERTFLLRLIENPSLLEHESFADLLSAIFHLTEELAYRVDVTRLSNTDYDHLSNDIKRAYISLLTEWLSYMRHLKDSYPYFYSLATRINPLKADASPELT